MRGLSQTRSNVEDAGGRYDGGGPIQVATPGLTLTVDGPRDAMPA